ncbi:ferrochelatase [Gammaproteobacteria bacterium]|nr:ferrochelatase [Gammaproteobacteria bacterium]
MKYQGFTDYKHGSSESLGILLVNLGTPDAPTGEALRPYLKQFLSDPRVIDLNKWLWQTILNVIVLNTRPKKSAEAYAGIWTEEGSPLLVETRRVAQKLQSRLSKRFPGPVAVEVGMTYGTPSIPKALHALAEKGARRILVLSLYPQYSCSTMASVFDAVNAELKTWRWIPEIRYVNQFHDHPLYIKALANSIREYRAEHGTKQKLLMSFHGVPQRYLVEGDPYHCQCHKTGRLLAAELGLGDDEWKLTFQSVFGREVWLKPYTDETLKSLPAQGVTGVDICCPGFSVDCVETLEEIDEENREYFEHAGGTDYHYIPCLNSREDHLDLIEAVAAQHTMGWPETAPDWQGNGEERQLQKQAADALEPMMEVSRPK